MPLDRLLQLHGKLADLAAETGAPTGPVSDLTDDAPVQAASRLSARDALALFESQLTARHLDRVAFELRARGEGFYTITSCGHEGNAVLGRVLRRTDPALLHYRSGGFFAERARLADEVDAIEAVVLGLTASSEDPIAGGRHKVFGSMPLCVLPQTSTIGSQLPKAVGMALCLERARRCDLVPRLGEQELPADAIVLTSLGDASLNHASSVAAVNAARWVAHQKLPLPLLILCEDNGLGLSVRTPRGWVEAMLAAGPALPYFRAPGWDLPVLFEIASQATELCRSERRPVVLHMECARLMGHSGADPDSVYRGRAELERAAARDPVLQSARLLTEHGLLGGQALSDLDAAIGERVWQAASAAIGRPKLRSASEVMEPLAASREAEVLAEVRSGKTGGKRSGAQPMGRMINWALQELMRRYPQTLVFGEDVAEKGGVYNITAGLWKEFGAGRVFNTLLDETTILALAQGAAFVGLLPIPEIQYLAFLHNAEDQLRGEAASTRFFSNGQLAAPMVLRVASFGYQKGFGGHFHNDNSLAVLRDIPGLRIATPSNGADAVRLLRTLAASARVEGRVTVFLEPIALYVQRDLHEAGDGELACEYPSPGEAIGIGEVGLYEAEAGDMTIATYANGVRIARRAARTLAREHGLRARIVDLRWLAPLPVEPVLGHARATGKLLVLDECRQAGNVGEGLVTEVARRTREVALSLVTAKESFVPLGDAAELVLPSEADVIEAALALRD